jgi:hypothetical protein
MAIADYYDGLDILEKDNGSKDFTKLSPSSIAKFFSSTRQWYGENLLGEDLAFNGSTASILGNIVHHFAEVAATGIPPTDADQDVADYLDSQTIDFDRPEVESLWREMSNTLIQGCISNTTIHSTEQFIHHELLPGVYVAGTYDALIANGSGYTVRDYKTTGKKPSGFSYDYRMQAHTYAYVLRKLGYHVNYVELQFAVRPTKTLPVRHFTFTEPFTDEDFARIEGQLTLIAHSVDTWNKHPEQRYLLAQDWRLKMEEPPQLFKD